MELILGTFSAEAFGAAVLASVTASIIGRASFGDVAFLTLPAFHGDRRPARGHLMEPLPSPCPRARPWRTPPIC